MSRYPAAGSREVKRAFRRAGWTERRAKGHTVFSSGPRVVTVDDDVKRFPGWLLSAMARQAGMTRDDFIDFLSGS